MSRTRFLKRKINSLTPEPEFQGCLLGEAVSDLRARSGPPKRLSSHAVLTLWGRGLKNNQLGSEGQCSQCSGVFPEGTPADTEGAPMWTWPRAGKRVGDAQTQGREAVPSERRAGGVRAPPKEGHSLRYARWAHCPWGSQQVCAQTPRQTLLRGNGRGWQKRQELLRFLYRFWKESKAYLSPMLKIAAAQFTKV